MNPHMHAELVKIAQVSDLWCFVALDKLAEAQTSAGYVNAPGSMNMGGPSSPPPPGDQAAGGITNMPGMSMHCDNCNAELKKAVAKCPQCGAKLKKKFDMKAIDKKLEATVTSEKQQPEDERLETGSTGGEAAENEELAEGSYADTGKYAGVFRRRHKSTIQKLPRGAQNPAAAAVLLGSAYYGNEGRKAIAEASKTAGARLGANPIMRIRRARRHEKLFGLKSAGNISKALDQASKL